MSRLYSRVVSADTVTPQKQYSSSSAAVCCGPTEAFMTAAHKMRARNRCFMSHRVFLLSFALIVVASQLRSMVQHTIVYWDHELGLASCAWCLHGDLECCADTA